MFNCEILQHKYLAINAQSSWGFRMCYDLHGKCTFNNADMYNHTVINNCSVFIKFVICNMVAATPDLPKSQEWQIQLE